MASLADVFEARARWAVEPCDCRFGMSCMPNDSVDAIVCDPPYGLSAPPDIRKVMLAWIADKQYHHATGGFMGKSWDSFVPGPDYWREALRVLKPGGHLLCFAGTRTVDLMGMALRFAGFEIRDCLCWLYGSGFPKSLNVSKQIDSMLGADRAPDEYTGANFKNQVFGRGLGGSQTLSRSDPCTAAAAAAAGYGTALKPAFEPCVIARKPLDGTVAANFMRHGTGALNVDGCRVETDGPSPAAERRESARRSGNAPVTDRSNSEQNAEGRFRGRRDADLYLEERPSELLGRWPANVVLDEEAAALLDAQAGDHPGMSGGGIHRADYAGGMFGAIDCPGNARGDSGGPSRFFYTAKASRSERDAGLEDFEARTAGEATVRTDDTDGLNSPRAGAGRTGGARNIHPTVKPVDLMRWLVRLVGRPGALILDPFTGSGSTGVAAVLEGMRFVGLELAPLHVDFARARIAHVIGGTWEREVKPERPVEKRQPSLFDALGGGK